MPSTDESLIAVENWVGEALPPAYRAFLGVHTDDHLVGDSTLFYGVDSFIERNETCETKDYCPDYVTIEDDSGGRQILLSLLIGNVLLVDAGSMNPQYAQEVALGFGEWFASRCPLPADV